MSLLASPAPFSRFNRGWQIAAVFSLLLAGGALLYLVNPATAGFLPPCPFRWLTGLHCPGCGTTRGLHQILHGNLAAAFRLNSLMVISIPFLAFHGLERARVSRGLPPLVRRRLPARAIYAIFVIVVLYGVLRNLEAYPFCLLAPH